MNKNVLVTGIGGNVGQGILRNIRALSYDINITGTNTELVSAGNHLCDFVYSVPFATDNAFIPLIEDICKKRKIDLIIPSTDFETYYLSRHKSILPAMACTDHITNEIFLDKYFTWIEFKKNHIPFAESILPSEYCGKFEEIIVKPRKGRGSRDISINPERYDSFTDQYIIQPYCRGIEITTAFYMTQQQELLGPITLERSLSHGTTVKSSVIFDYDTTINHIIREIIQSLTIIGPCNIQSVVQSDQTVIPFEINARISGTNSIRSQFGFNDVKFIIDEYLYEKPLQKPTIKKGCALRMLTDIIYPDISIDEITTKNANWYTF